MADKTAIWKSLEQHAKEFQSKKLRDLFAADPKRFDKFSLEVGDILLDYSKNLISEETLGLLIKLAEQANVKGWADKMFTGEVRLRALSALEIA